MYTCLHKTGSARRRAWAKKVRAIPACARYIRRYAYRIAAEHPDVVAGAAVVSATIGLPPIRDRRPQQSQSGIHLLGCHRGVFGWK
jgi:hypothetical protein